jgi:hypothetical protein
MLNYLTNNVLDNFVVLRECCVFGVYLLVIGKRDSAVFSRQFGENPLTLQNIERNEKTI